MSSGLLSIGASALDAAYTALRTTGNNIANVNTPGYSRQVVNVSAQVATGTGSLYVGTGVKVDSIQRVYSDFLTHQANLAQALSSQADAGLTLANQLNGLFANSSTGIGSAVDSFFAQVQGLANQPGSAASRQSLLATAHQLAGQFNDLAGQMQLMSQNADQQISQQIATVNTTVAQVAQLNDQISLARASGGDPNTLLDQRDQAIATLNQSIGITTVAQNDGSINLFLANGQPLLVGDRPTALASGADPMDPEGVVVGTKVGNTIVALDPNASGGGSIGALLQFRATTLPGVQNQIGRLATVLSAQFNALQSLGVDQSGAKGANFFSVPSVVTVSASTNPDAATVSVGAQISDATQLQASDYRLQVNGAGSYTLTRLADNTTTSLASLPASVDGMTLSFAGGTPAAGDVFTIAPVRLGAQNISVALAQGSQIAAASPLTASTGAANGGSIAVQNLALSPLTAALSNPGGGPIANPPMLDKVVVTFSTPPAQYSTVTWAGGVPGPASSPQAYVPGQVITGAGWQLTLTGNPSSGDTVTVQPGAVGSGDNRVALMMSQVQGVTSVGLSATATGGTTLTGAVAALVADVGSIAAKAQSDQQSRSAILQQAQTAQSSVSGVNLDEEASRLLQYQQQYQAAARIIQTATTVFNSILQAAGGA
jgi:flagellar hook-associated protein 1 FlgK